MSKTTYRVTVRLSGTRTYEIDAETEDEARAYFSEGALVYDDCDFNEVESITAIDKAAK